MEIKTKFAIGDKVYIIFKENSMVKLFTDEITEIIISSEGALYYCNVMCEVFKEEEIVLINDKESLIKKIEELVVEPKKETKKPVEKVVEKPVAEVE